MKNIKELIQKNEAITETGLLDLCSKSCNRNDELINEHQISFASFEQGLVFICCYIPVEKAGMADRVMLITEGIQITEFIEMFALKSYADLDLISQTDIWDRFFMKGKAALHFDDLVQPHEVFYTADGKWQRLEDVKEYFLAVEQ